MRGCWVIFRCRGVLLIWIKVGQGPIALAVGAGGGCLDVFLSSIFALYFLPLWEIEILSQRAVKPKTTNQPIIHRLDMTEILFKGPLNRKSLSRIL